jgi:hypothetical protein
MREFHARVGLSGGDPEVGSLDDPKVFTPKLAIYTCDKQPFLRVPEGVATFEKLPG